MSTGSYTLLFFHFSQQILNYLTDEPQPIDMIIDKLNKAKKLGATHVIITPSGFYADTVDYIDIQPINIK